MRNCCISVEPYQYLKVKICFNYDFYGIPTENGNCYNYPERHFPIRQIYIYIKYINTTANCNGFHAGPVLDEYVFLERFMPVHTYLFIKVSSKIDCRGIRSMQFIDNISMVTCHVVPYLIQCVGTHHMFLLLASNFNMFHELSSYADFSDDHRTPFFEDWSSLHPQAPKPRARHKRIPTTSNETFQHQQTHINAREGRT